MKTQSLGKRSQGNTVEFFKTTSGCYIVAITVESFLVGIILSGQPRAGRALFNSCYQIKAVTGLLPGAVACRLPKTGCVIEVRL